MPSVALCQVTASSSSATETVESLAQPVLHAAYHLAPVFQ